MTTLGAWLRFRREGVPITLLNCLAISFMRVLTRDLVDAISLAHRSGLDAGWEELRVHALAGGRPLVVAQTLATAHERALPVHWMAACAIDLAGRNPMQLVDAFAQARERNPSLTFEQMMKELDESQNTTSEHFP